MYNLDYWQMEDAQDMFDECPRVFVYGTLKPGRGNNSLLGASKLLGYTTTVERFALGGEGVPYAFPESVVPQEMRSRLCHPVYGALYQMDSMYVARQLDGLEGYPHLYNRRVITTELGPNAWIYTIEEWEWASDIEAANFHEGVWEWN